MFNVSVLAGLPFPQGSPSGLNAPGTFPINE